MSNYQLPHTPTSKPKAKEFFQDRKKLVSQVDLRNIRPMEDKIPFASPKFVNYAATLTQKNSSSKKINFGVTSPKSFFPPYRKDGQDSLNTYTRSETMKSFSNRLESKTNKDTTITEGITRSDSTYKAFANSTSVVLQAANKNLTLNPKKSYKTDVSTVESKADVLDKGLSPKYEEKYKAVKQNEVVKQIEAQIQMHRRVKKPNQATKSVALSTPKDLSLGNDSKLMEATSHRRSNSTKDVPWGKLELPVGPEVVLDRYSSFLAPHEREEIKRFTEIYYISDLGHKLPAKDEAECDDERGDYIVIRNDHIQYRYEVLEMVGRGSFGQVMKVFDHKTKEHVALKIIRSPKKFHIQAKVEIKLLKYMMDNNAQDFNITDFKDYFVFRKHVCLVFDLMSLNLYDFLKKNKFKGFSLNVIRKFAIQILYALKFLAQHKIIHCDLKPENILLKQFNKTGVKLIDFGSSCFENEKLYTYIQSRFYRSPEIILGLSYSTQIDMWSFGCLLCELYLGYPLFAGDSEQDQLLAMMEVLGSPDQKLITESPKKSKFFEDDLNVKIVPNAKGKIRKPDSINLDTTLNCEDQSFVDLVKYCLKYDPNERFTPTAALAHEWILKGLPPELKAQHMKLLEKSNASTYRISSCKDRSSTLDLKDSDEYAISRQDRTTNDTTRSKHKKTISVPVQRADLSKGLLGNISTSFKADRTDEKSFNHLYKKGSNMSTNTVDEDSIANITINLNESKQSSGTNKKQSQSKPASSFNTPQASAAKDNNKIGNFNNFFAAHNQKVLAENLRKQQSMETPKKQTKEEEEETIVNKLRNSYMGNFHITKVNKRTLSQKSFSIDKNLFSPKGSDHIFKSQNQEDSRVMSASRGGNFPSLKSPNAKKKL